MAYFRRSKNDLALLFSTAIVVAALVCSCSNKTTIPPAPETQVDAGAGVVTSFETPSAATPRPSSTSSASQLRSDATEAASASTPTISDSIPTSIPSSPASPGLQTADQEQIAIDMTNQTVVGGSVQQRFAQVFTVTQSGYITAVGLPMNCQPAARLLIRIEVASGGVPGGEVLASQEFLDSALPSYLVGTSIGFPMLEFSDPPPVSAGALYAFILETEDGDCNLHWGPQGDSYPGGAAYFEVSDNPPGWREILNPVRDLAFQIFISDSTIVK